MTAAPRRCVQAFDVIQPVPGTVHEGRHLESVRLTVFRVTDDGCDATEWTGGPVIHLPARAFRIVTPPRGGAR
jgi:hypothetical protein